MQLPNVILIIGLRNLINEITISSLKKSIYSWLAKVFWGKLNNLEKWLPSLSAHLNYLESSKNKTQYPDPTPRGSILMGSVRKDNGYQYFLNSGIILTCSQD